MQDHWGDTLQPALLQHLKLTLIAVAIGFVIAFASALVAYRYRRLDQPIGLFSDFLYTIPSLALFQLLVPLTGLTVTTVEVALVSYTLLILYRNILEGLRGVPEEVREAARGMGLTPLQTLVRVELPLAAPSIIAGLRIATVSTISIATDRRVRHPAGARLSDLHRDQAGRSSRRRSSPRARSRSCSRSAPTRSWSLAQRALTPLEARVILADTFSWGTFPDAIRFIGDNPRLLWDKTLAAARALGRRARDRDRDRAAARRRPRPLPPRLVPRDQRLEHRPRAAEPRPDRVRPARLRHLLLEQHCRARRPRRPADPDERLLRGRRGRPERRRGGAGDGDDAVATSCCASSCRSRCR